MYSSLVGYGDTSHRSSYKYITKGLGIIIRVEPLLSLHPTKAVEVVGRLLEGVQVVVVVAVAPHLNFM
jgi:hypothetical protein